LSVKLGMTSTFRAPAGEKSSHRPVTLSRLRARRP
jgi:hypothetical protein